MPRLSRRARLRSPAARALLLDTINADVLATASWEASSHRLQELSVEWVSRARSEEGRAKRVQNLLGILRQGPLMEVRREGEPPIG